MKFETQFAPHLTPSGSVRRMMQRVLKALIPAAMAHVYFFGPGLIFNIVVAGGTALAAEAAMLRLRGLPLRPYLLDFSALVTAVLLAFTLPPLTPWWVTATGAIFAIVIAKHLYGGLGQNPFNPAMTAYVVLLVSFPVYMTSWLPPLNVDIGIAHPGFGDSLFYLFTGHLPAGQAMDTITAASPLDVTRNQLAQARNYSEIKNGPLFGNFAGKGWEWIGIYSALGGMWLLYKGVIRWQIPSFMLLGLFVTAAVMYVLNPGAYVPSGFHLFAGATLFGAFFIATDPVTAPISPRGQKIYGAGIGILVYVIRTWGGFPDGVAFAVLFMNMTTPLIDHYTRPRVYGHD
ncbi:MAG: electron transport complex subunit RsxD [Proteobacteria bacterium]|nr:electron transport complex subunit RsxD [Pseudomonadota bacterium]MCH8930308.1 electron transport complex subunit RsxD [Pseudomonadota bacterium]